jgi:hypothetical protein
MVFFVNKLTQLNNPVDLALSSNGNLQTVIDLISESFRKTLDRASLGLPTFQKSKRAYSVGGNTSRVRLLKSS